MTFKELREEAKQLGINSFGMTKEALEQAIVDAAKAKITIVEEVIPDSIDAHNGNKGAHIRKLLAAGKTRAEIARILNTHYSYVHTVAKKYERETGAAVAAAPINRTDSTSQKIRDLYDKGWERAAITKKLKLEYSFVHNVIKRYKEVKEHANCN